MFLRYFRLASMYHLSPDPAAQTARRVKQIRNNIACQFYPANGKRLYVEQHRRHQKLFRKISIADERFSGL